MSMRSVLEYMAHACMTEPKCLPRLRSEMVLSVLDIWRSTPNANIIDVAQWMRCWVKASLEVSRDAALESIKMVR